MNNTSQDDENGSSIPWISGENHQETYRFRPEPVGKCREFDAGIRWPYPAAGFDSFLSVPSGTGWIRSPDPFTGILLPSNLRNTTEPAVSVPDCPTWDRAYLNSGLHLHSKYLIRKWRMAHFVSCHQWVFSNYHEKQHKVNTQVKWRWISKRWRQCDDACDTLMWANFLGITM